MDKVRRKVIGALLLLFYSFPAHLLGRCLPHSFIASASNGTDLVETQGLSVPNYCGSRLTHPEKALPMKDLTSKTFNYRPNSVMLNFSKMRGKAMYQHINHLERCESFFNLYIGLYCGQCNDHGLA